MAGKFKFEYYSKTPNLEYYFCCGPKFLLYKSPQFWNKPTIGGHMRCPTVQFYKKLNITKFVDGWTDIREKK